MEYISNAGNKTTISVNVGGCSNSRWSILGNKALKHVSSYVETYIHGALCPLWFLACARLCLYLCVWSGGGIAKLMPDSLLRSTSCKHSPNLSVNRWRYRTFCYRYFPLEINQHYWFILYVIQ
jgi:hypothetical protein